LLAPSPATAHSHKKKGLEIVHPWTRAMLDKSATTIMVSMTIKNRGKAADRLLRASCPLAESVEIRTPGADPATSGRQAGLAIGAGRNLDLKGGGPHLLLNGFKKQLGAYESFVMTLVFEKAGPVVIEVMVEEAEQPKAH
jgi:copper(I)-binding protein